MVFPLVVRAESARFFLFVSITFTENDRFERVFGTQDFVGSGVAALTELSQGNKSLNIDQYIDFKKNTDACSLLEQIAIIFSGRLRCIIGKTVAMV